MTKEKAFEKVNAELDRAQIKFPAYHSSHEGYAVIYEELDEMWDDVKTNQHQAAVKEAIQVAATAIRYLIDLG